MSVKGYPWIKFVMIGSLALNIAFVAGYAVKTLSERTEPASQEEFTMHASTDEAGKRLEFRRLCRDNPGFDVLFHEYIDHYSSREVELLKVKKQFLEELKKDSPDSSLLKTLSSKIGGLNEEMNLESLEHLQKIKQVLSADDFSLLITKLERRLARHSGRGNLKCDEPPAGKGMGFGRGRGMGKGFGNNQNK